MRRQAQVSATYACNAAVTNIGHYMASAMPIFVFFLMCSVQLPRLILTSQDSEAGSAAKQHGSSSNLLAQSEYLEELAEVVCLSQSPCLELTTCSSCTKAAIIATQVLQSSPACCLMLHGVRCSPFDHTTIPGLCKCVDAIV